jgi:cytoskeleton protein RodZ
MIVTATADAWVTVKQKSGPPLLNKLMHAGDSWPVPSDKPGLLLTTGNAGGTELDVDGTKIATLGGSGMVRRDLPLDADALKSAPLPPIMHVRKPAAPPPDHAPE